MCSGKVYLKSWDKEIRLSFWNLILIVLTSTCVEVLEGLSLGQR